MNDDPWGIYYHDDSGHFHFRSPSGEDIDLHTCDEDVAIAMLISGNAHDSLKKAKDLICGRYNKYRQDLSPKASKKPDDEDPKIESLTRPMYYGGKGALYEVFKVMEAWDPEAFLAFCRLNTVKYLARVGKKEGANPQDDYDKAAVYAKEAAAVHRRLNG